MDATDKATMIERAINVLQNAGESAVEQIDNRVKELESEIFKLRQIRKVITKVSGPKLDGTKSATPMTELENQIVELLQAKGKPMRPSLIAGELHVAPISVGVCVKKSQRLAKNIDGLVVIRK